MSGPAYTYIYYFVPLDGDTEEHLNVFLLRKPVDQVTVGDIEQGFPLPGKYMFRFKQVFQKTSHVWLDVSTNPSRRAPQYQGRIVCKVTRIALELGSDSHSTGASVSSTATRGVTPPVTGAVTTGSVSVSPSLPNSSPLPMAANPQPATVPSSTPAAAPAVAAAARPATAAPAAAPAPSQPKHGNKDLLGLFDVSTDSAVPPAVPAQNSPFSPKKSAAGRAPMNSFTAAAMRTAPSTFRAQGAMNNNGNGGGLMAGSSSQSVSSLGVEGWNMTPGSQAAAAPAAPAPAPASAARARSSNRSPVFDGNILTGKHGVNMW